MASFKNVSVGLKGLGGTKPDGIILAHGIDKGKALACVEKMHDELVKDGSEMTRYGDVVVGKGKTGEQFAMMFVNDNTALMALGDNANVAGIKAAAQATST